MKKAAPLRAIDLFCGAGGSAWGAQAAGIEVVAAFDLWELAGKNHSINFPEANFYHGRLENLNLSQVARELGKIDLILSSPECTNHSPAKGNKPRCEESKNTAFQVIRFAMALKPRWIVIENVVSMKRWSRYQEFKKGLTDLGYHITEQVLNSSHFKVPQARRRLFLLCDLEAKPLSTPRLSNRGRLRTASSVVDLNGDYRWSPLRSEKRAAATLERAEKGIQTVGNSTVFLLVYYGSDHAGGW